MHYYFNDDIQTETVNALIEKLQNIEGEINLWFSTDGGSPTAMDFLVSFLNSRKQDIIITLTNRLCSSGTILLVDFEGKIIINDRLDFVLFHAFDRESYSIRKDRDIPAKKLTKQDIIKNKKLTKKFLDKGILTQKQIKKYHKGSDVVFLKKGINKLKQKINARI